MVDFFETLVDVLQHRVATSGDDSVFSFLNSELDVTEHFSYADLLARARQYALAISLHANPGQRALLLFQPGLEFIAAFFGCLIAGAVAVPVAAPRKNSSWARLQAVCSSASVCCVVAHAELLDELAVRASDEHLLLELPWVLANDLPVGSPVNGTFKPCRPEDLAMLQYTSGSTGQPRGVMLTHHQLISNSRAIARAMVPNTKDVGVIWLPPHHDMGLIGGILQPIYSGLHFYLMAPSAFLQRPIRWLEAITKTAATITAAPNFAFELCARRILDEQLCGLDLASLQVVFNGAEPIHPSTMQQFTEKFSACGFNPSALMPCYGLAEATLLVSSRQRMQGSRQLAFSKSGLMVGALTPALNVDNDAQCIVSTGFVDTHLQVRIVDPISKQVCGNGQVGAEVGEVWLRGDTVGKGYWADIEQTAEVFQASLDKQPNGWLRTGDLGALYEGELWITGRVKDLIIIRGQNHYPQDIEATALLSHPALNGSAAIAFSVPVEGAEGLVILTEVHRHTTADQLAAIETKIRSAVSLGHQIIVYAITFVKQNSLPKTTSGKLQRRLARSFWHHNTLNVMTATIIRAS